MKSMFIIGSILTCSWLGLPTWAVEGTPTISADAPWLDTTGNEIEAQGGCVLRHGERFFWYGVAFSTGQPREVRCYASTDLATWTRERTALPTAAGRRVKGLIDRDGRTWLTVRHGTNLQIWNAPTPTGSFSLANDLPLPEAIGGGDASLFRSEDGTAHVTYSVPAPAGGGSLILAAPLSLTMDRIATPTVRIKVSNKRGQPLTVQSPSVWKRNQTWYMTAGERDDWASSPTWYATATSLTGPWTPWNRLTRSMVHPAMLAFDTFNSQPNSVVEIQGSQGSLFVYWGDRWSQFTGYGSGKQVVMALDFVDDVPGLTWCKPWHPDVVLGTMSHELRRNALWRDPPKKPNP